VLGERGGGGGAVIQLEVRGEVWGFGPKSQNRCGSVSGCNWAAGGRRGSFGTIGPPLWYPGWWGVGGKVVWWEGVVVLTW
jgi:hypothetical protein